MNTLRGGLSLTAGADGRVAVGEVASAWVSILSSPSARDCCRSTKDRSTACAPPVWTRHDISHPAADQAESCSYWVVERSLRRVSPARGAQTRQRPWLRNVSFSAPAPPRWFLRVRPSPKARTIAVSRDFPPGRRRASLIEPSQDA